MGGPTIYSDDATVVPDIRAVLGKIVDALRASATTERKFLREGPNEYMEGRADAYDDAARIVWRIGDSGD